MSAFFFLLDMGCSAGGGRRSQIHTAISPRRCMVAPKQAHHYSRELYQLLLHCSQSLAESAKARRFILTLLREVLGPMGACQTS